MARRRAATKRYGGAPTDAYQLLIKSPTAPRGAGNRRGTVADAPGELEKDRVLPHPRFTRNFTTQLPKDTQVTTLDGVGHIPMFEAPVRIDDLFADFVDRQVGRDRATG